MLLRNRPAKNDDIKTKVPPKISKSIKPVPQSKVIKRSSGRLMELQNIKLLKPVPQSKVIRRSSGRLMELQNIKLPKPVPQSKVIKRSSGQLKELQNIKLHAELSKPLMKLRTSTKAKTVESERNTKRQQRDNKLKMKLRRITSNRGEIKPFQNLRSAKVNEKNTKKDVDTNIKKEKGTPNLQQCDNSSPESVLYTVTNANELQSPLLESLISVSKISPMTEVEEEIQQNDCQLSESSNYFEENCNFFYRRKKRSFKSEIILDDVVTQLSKIPHSPPPIKWKNELIFKAVMVQINNKLFPPEKIKTIHQLDDYKADYFKSYQHYESKEFSHKVFKIVKNVTNCCNSIKNCFEFGLENIPLGITLPTIFQSAYNPYLLLLATRIICPVTEASVGCPTACNNETCMGILSILSRSIVLNTAPGSILNNVLPIVKFYGLALMIIVLVNDLKEMSLTSTRQFMFNSESNFKSHFDVFEEFVWKSLYTGNQWVHSMKRDVSRSIAVSLGGDDFPIATPLCVLPRLTNLYQLLFMDHMNEYLRIVTGFDGKLKSFNEGNGVQLMSAMLDNCHFVSQLGVKQRMTYFMRPNEPEASALVLHWALLLQFRLPLSLATVSHALCFAIGLQKQAKTIKNELMFGSLSSDNSASNYVVNSDNSSSPDESVAQSISLGSPHSGNKSSLNEIINESSVSLMQFENCSSPIDNLSMRSNKSDASEHSSSMDISFYQPTKNPLSENVNIETDGGTQASRCSSFSYYQSPPHIDDDVSINKPLLNEKDKQLQNMSPYQMYPQNQEDEEIKSNSSGLEINLDEREDNDQQDQSDSTNCCNTFQISEEDTTKLEQSPDPFASPVDSATSFRANDNHTETSFKNILSEYSIMHKDDEPPHMFHSVDSPKSNVAITTSIEDQHKSPDSQQCSFFDVNDFEEWQRLRANNILSQSFLEKEWDEEDEEYVTPNEREVQAQYEDSHDETKQLHFPSGIIDKDIVSQIIHEAQADLPIAEEVDINLGEDQYQQIEEEMEVLVGQEIKMLKPPICSTSAGEFFIPASQETIIPEGGSQSFAELPGFFAVVPPDSSLHENITGVHDFADEVDFPQN